jgi:multimeric flavodoxin WrbA
MVLITPIYSYNITAIMKSFIDRLYSFYNFSDERPGKWSSQLADQGRKAIIAAIGEQATHEEGGMETTLDTLRRSVVALGYDIIDELPVLGVFAKGKIREHPQVLKHAEELGGKIASFLSA